MGFEEAGKKLAGRSQRSEVRGQKVTVLRIAAMFVLCCAVNVWAGDAPLDVSVAVFEGVEIKFDKELAESVVLDGCVIRKLGLEIEKAVELPAGPVNQRDARRIVATVMVEPVLVEEEGKIRPGDPWTRLGSLTVVKKATAGAAGAEVELMRFITGFGGRGTFTQDVTALAPLLEGATTLRLSMGTYKNPAWKVSVTLNYTTEGVGYRRPIWAVPLMYDQSVTAEKNKLKATVTVPTSLARPRLRIISTGHASDGTGGDEFVTRTHVLRIDGVEVARWRPWVEDSGSVRKDNPMSGRMVIDGRELWSSDLDRSGWRCGSVVEPTNIPVPELGPGKHSIEVEILGIRPKDQKSNFGYWRLSCVAVADEPWPEHPEPKQE